MSRIRTIKPEFWTSEQVISCTPLARLLFIGMWNFCDDSGRIPRKARQLKAQLFPADDDISVANVQGLVAELANVGLVAAYSVDGVEYLQVTGWHHQRIDKPQPARYPDPPPEIAKLLAEHSANVRDGRERKGRESKGKESKGAEAGRARGAPPPAAASSENSEQNGFHLLDDVTDRWNGHAAMLRAPVVTELTKRRAQRLKAMFDGLKAYGYDDPDEAFKFVLQKLDESFFVHEPKRPLTFDQLISEDFWPQLIEGAFTYAPPKPKRQ